MTWGGSHTLTTFLGQQIKSNAEVELFTTAPNLTKKQEFHRKYGLLRQFSILGLKIFLNQKLHAKAFCFNNDGAMLTTMLGSANLTSGGMQQHLELAFFSGRHAVYHSAMALIRIFMRDQDTVDFAVWRMRNALTIKSLGASL